MQKEEIIQLHTLFAQIKNQLEGKPPHNNGTFIEYEEFGVLPHHVHKSKNDHKKAVFILGKEIAEMFSHNRYSSIGRVADRLYRMERRIR